MLPLPLPADVAPPGPSGGELAVIVLLVLVVLAGIAALAVFLVRSGRRRGAGRGGGGDR